MQLGLKREIRERLRHHVLRATVAARRELYKARHYGAAHARARDNAQNRGRKARGHEGQSARCGPLAPVSASACLAWWLCSRRWSSAKGNRSSSSLASCARARATCAPARASARGSRQHMLGP
jgi:hypothetical protein